MTETKNKTVPADVLPGTALKHPEYGGYLIRPAGPPLDDFEGLYYDHLEALIKRKWDRLFSGPPYPEIKRAELLGEQDLEPGCPFAPVQGVLVTIPKKAWNRCFMRPGRLEKSLAKNKCTYHEIDRDTAVVSPFFEWELADFWEEGRYEDD